MHVYGTRENVLGFKKKFFYRNTFVKQCNKFIFGIEYRLLVAQIKLEKIMFN